MSPIPFVPNVDNELGLPLVNTGVRNEISEAQLEHYGRLTSASDATLDAYKQIAERLGGVGVQSAYAAKAYLEPGGDLSLAPLITGIGLGLPDPRHLGYSTPGSGCLHLYTSEPIDTAAAIDNVRGTLAIHAFDDGKHVPVTAIHTGTIDALHRKRWSPMVAGTSIGHPSVTAGTLGAFAVGLKTPRDERLLVLSNNHVLAAVNEGKLGDSILQPGPSDGGIATVHAVGGLENYVPINFGGDNVVDAATAWVDPSNIRRDALYYRGSQPAFYNFGMQSLEAKVGLLVGKSGRTTGLTAGYVSAIGARIRVDLGLGRSAWFVDQIAIRGQDGNFSSGGDSGSLVWSWDKDRMPVALLFAGGGGTTFANPIQRVLDALDIRLISE